MRRWACGALGRGGGWVSHGSRLLFWNLKVLILTLLHQTYRAPWRFQPWWPTGNLNPEWHDFHSPTWSVPIVFNLLNFRFFNFFFNQLFRTGLVWSPAARRSQPLYGLTVTMKNIRARFFPTSWTHSVLHFSLILLKVLRLWWHSVRVSDS